MESSRAVRCAQSDDAAGRHARKSGIWSEAAGRRSAVLLATLAFSSAVLPLAGATAAARAQDDSAVNRHAAAADDRNTPPARDGLHDPDLAATHLLQSPQEAFAGLPHASGGNYVNWTEALKRGAIAPRYDRLDAHATPPVLQLDVVREVRKIWGSMPPAVFPHAAHSEWVDCPVCHPALFVAEKGKNTMTMGEIMAGRKCGVCHGTVAFPVVECKRCHYRPLGGHAQRRAPKKSGR